MLTLSLAPDLMLRHFFLLASAQIVYLFHDEGLYHIEISLLICTANQWTGFSMIGTSVTKELINCVFHCERKWKDYLLEIELVLISNYSATVSTNKYYTNLIYANQLKKRICRSIISVIQKQRTQYNTKAQKDYAMDVPSPQIIQWRD